MSGKVIITDSDIKKFEQIGEYIEKQKNAKQFLSIPINVYNDLTNKLLEEVEFQTSQEIATAYKFTKGNINDTFAFILLIKHKQFNYHEKLGDNNLFPKYLNNWYWESQDEISTMLNISKQKLMAIIKVLAKHGYLVVKSVQIKIGNKYKRSCAYALLPYPNKKMTYKYYNYNVNNQLGKLEEEKEDFFEDPFEKPFEDSLNTSFNDPFEDIPF